MKIKYLKTSVIIVTILFSFSSCIKDELEAIEDAANQILWETDSHFTDGKKGSYTLKIDNLPIYTHLEDDIALSVGALTLPAIQNLSDKTSTAPLVASVGAIGSTLIIGECEDCAGMTAVTGRTDVPIDQTPVFIGTSGTIERLSKDHIIIDSYMELDDGSTRHLEANIYVGVIVADL